MANLCWVAMTSHHHSSWPSSVQSYYNHIISAIILTYHYNNKFHVQLDGESLLSRDNEEREFLVEYSGEGGEGVDKWDVLALYDYWLWSWFWNHNPGCVLWYEREGGGGWFQPNFAFVPLLSETLGVSLVSPVSPVSLVSIVWLVSLVIPVTRVSEGCGGGGKLTCSASAAASPFSTAVTAMSLVPLVSLVSLVSPVQLWEAQLNIFDAQGLSTVAGRWFLLV